MRYIVLDLNILEKDFSHIIRRDDHVVLTHTLLLEIAGIKEADRLAKHEKHLFPWIKTRGQQIWIAHEPATFIEREAEGGISNESLKWRDLETTQRIRDALNSHPINFCDTINSIRSSPGYEIHEKSRTNFCENTKEFVQKIKGISPHDLGGFLNEMKKDFASCAIKIVNSSVEDHLKSFVHDPAQRLLPSEGVPLESIPDMAIGRLNRIALWNAMAYLAGKTHQFSNNYEDAVYAFTASYTGYLATDDIRLQKMVGAIFPRKVKILKSEKIPVA